MAGSNGYAPYQTPSGPQSYMRNESSTANAGSAPQEYAYAPPVHHAQSLVTGPTPASGSVQQYPWPPVEGQLFGMAPGASGASGAYQHNSGTSFPAGQGASSEGNFQARPAIGSYGELPGGSRPPTQINRTTGIDPATMQSIGTAVPSETSLAHMSVSRPRVAQDDQETHVRLVTVLCPYCGTVYRRVYAQEGTQATEHEPGVCSSCRRFFFIPLHHTGGSEPFATTATMPSSTGTGSSGAPGIRNSTPSSPTEQADQTVACPRCGKVLTGSHAPGNLTRHQKSRSCAASPNRKQFFCDFSGCQNQYERSDALLNHKRRKHNAPGPSKPSKRSHHGTSAEK